MRTKAEEVLVVLVETLLEHGHQQRAKEHDMSTRDVPGAGTAILDELAMGCWAEADDGSMIFVAAVEDRTVVFEMFDTATTPPVFYRTSMPEARFKERFSWTPESGNVDDTLWIWHDKRPFPWAKVLSDYPSTGHVSATEELHAAARIGDSLGARSHRLSDHPNFQGSTVSGRRVMERLRDAVDAFLA